MNVTHGYGHGRDRDVGVTTKLGQARSSYLITYFLFFVADDEKKDEIVFGFKELSFMLFIC
jgi:hypothetical protein